MSKRKKLPPWWVTVPVVIISLPFYAVWVVMWLAWRIFNFGMDKGWKKKKKEDS